MNDEIIRVEPMKFGEKNSVTADSLSGEKTRILGEENDKCYWNGKEFSEGSMVCDSGIKYKCHMGLWIKQAQEC
ncbi:MAG: hypothetical protein JW882_08030 [Deltaproteobacteria bacterium]|nr:hypothetical protein [Deltaproteobacteria bacterium]